MSGVASTDWELCRCLRLALILRNLSSQDRDAEFGHVPPPPIHHREDEIFYVLEGEIAVSVGDRTIQGTVVHIHSA
jgi:uncharacterized cupin superfamily protein